MKNPGEPAVVQKAAITRRRFLAFGAIAAAQLVVPGIAMARTRIRMRAKVPRRSLEFYNLHTGESLKTTYWVGGRYQPGELDRVNYILRDFRANEVKPIDPTLLDLLAGIRKRITTTQPIQIISGYRSPLTNAMLHANSEGVAVHSLHIDGKAIDICVEGRSLAQIRQAAWDLQGGGVGYYPRTGFVHVDTGHVRWW